MRRRVEEKIKILGSMLLRNGRWVISCSYFCWVSCMYFSGFHISRSSLPFLAKAQGTLHEMVGWWGCVGPEPHSHHSPTTNF